MSGFFRSGAKPVAVLLGLYALWLAVGGGPADPSPEDGGAPIEFETDPEIIAILAADRCVRPERGAGTGASDIASR